MTNERSESGSSEGVYVWGRYIVLSDDAPVPNDSPEGMEYVRESDLVRRMYTGRLNGYVGNNHAAEVLRSILDNLSPVDRKRADYALQRIDREAEIVAAHGFTGAPDRPQPTSDGGEPTAPPKPEGISERVDRLEYTLSRLHARTARQERELAREARQTGERISTMRDSLLQKIDAVAAGVAKQVATVSNKIDRLERDTSEVFARWLERVEAAMSATQAQVDLLRKEVPSDGEQALTKGAMAEQDSRINHLSTKVSDMQAEINLLRADLDEVAERLGSNRLERLEAALDAIQKQVGQVLPKAIQCAVDIHEAAQEEAFTVRNVGAIINANEVLDATKPDDPPMGEEARQQGTAERLLESGNRVLVAIADTPTWLEQIRAGLSHSERSRGAAVLHHGRLYGDTNTGARVYNAAGRLLGEIAGDAQAGTMRVQGFRS